MKKLVTAIGLAAAIGIISQSVEARWGNGPGTGSGHGPCGNCDQNSPVDAEARHSFFDETQELRTQLREKRSEYFALLNRDNVDKDEAQTIWSDMFDLQQQLQAKAAEAGLERGADRIAGIGQFGRGCRSFRGNHNAPYCGGQGCAQYPDENPTD